MGSDLRIFLESMPSHPYAGEWFILVVGLEDGAVAEELQVTFEKHRIVVDTSGNHELCIIDVAKYFADGSLAPLEIRPGESAGVSRVKVLADAASRPCPSDEIIPEPVDFPDRLLFTAFVTNKRSPGEPPTISGKEHCSVTIAKRE